MLMIFNCPDVDFYNLKTGLFNGTRQLSSIRRFVFLQFYFTVKVCLILIFYHENVLDASKFLMASKS